MITERDRAKTLALGQPVPAARTEGLVTTSTDDDVLVYDQERHHIHHLNHTAAVIWRLCDGRRSVAQLAQAASSQEAEPINADAVRLAIDKLAGANLLVAAVPDSIRLSTQSRRSFMKRAAVAGAVAVPAIVSMTAPANAANTQKGCGTVCNTKNSGNNGNCPGAGAGYECNHCWKDGIVKPGFGNGDCDDTIYPGGTCYCGCPPSQLVGGVCPTPGGAPINNQQNAPLNKPLTNSVQNQSVVAPTDTPTPEPTQPPAPQATQPPPPPQATQPVVDQQPTDQTQGAPADQTQSNSAPADVPSPTPTDTPPPPPPPAAPNVSAPTGGNPNTAGATVVPNVFGNGNNGNNGSGGG